MGFRRLRLEQAEDVPERPKGLRGTVERPSTDAALDRLVHVPRVFEQDSDRLACVEVVRHRGVESREGFLRRISEFGVRFPFLRRTAALGLHRANRFPEALVGSLGLLEQFRREVDRPAVLHVNQEEPEDLGLVALEGR